ncbi:MAG: hypothetical protein PVSMB1_13350 [Gemmatimonadaceae bacterium]
MRNYQARNFMRDEMKRGDLVFFYHSNADPPAIVGVAEISREGYPDETAFETGHPHFDPKSSPKAPTWVVVDVTAVEPLPRPVTLDELRHSPELAAMALLRRPRLSVQPVTPGEWVAIHKLARTVAPG